MQLLQAPFTEEHIVDAGVECAHCHNNNTDQIHAMPEQLYTMGVRLHQVVQCAQHQADLRTKEEDPEHSIVHGRNIEDLRSGQATEENRYGKRQKESRDHVSVDVASLVVHEGQAPEDLIIVCLLWSIATEDEFVIKLPLGDLSPSDSLGVGLRRAWAVGRAAHLDFSHLPFLKICS